MMAGLDSGAWVDRQTPATRAALLILLVVLALFTAGFIVGFGVAFIEEGRLPRKPLALVIVAALPLIIYGLYRAIRTLLRPSLAAGLSPFERRYAKMWMIMMALGVPVGVVLALFSVRGNPRDLLQSTFIDGPLPPVGAIIAAITLAGLLGVAIILYHRTIDDHEERAYLWGSQLAYYFLALAIPVYWLLERGGLVASLTTSIALLILLASCFIQSAVWAWFKFR